MALPFRQRDVYGVGIDLEPHAALARLESRMDAVVRAMTEAVTANIARHGIDLVHGTVRLRPAGIVEVVTPGGEIRTLQGKTILIATGSHPFHPPGYSPRRPGCARLRDGAAPRPPGTQPGRDWRRCRGL